jgi:hypothetical protein
LRQRPSLPVPASRRGPVAHERPPCARAPPAIAVVRRNCATSRAPSLARRLLIGAQTSSTTKENEMDETEKPPDPNQVVDQNDDLMIEDLEDRYVQGKWNCSCSSCTCNCTTTCCFYIF